MAPSRLRAVALACILTVSIAWPASVFLTGCGGGGKGATRGRAALELPAGFSIPATELRAVTAAGESAPGSDGTLSVPLPDNGPSPVLVVDSQDRLILIGMVDPAAAEPSRLDSRETAAALLGLALGVQNLPNDSRDAAWRQVRQHPAITDLATAVAQRLAADPGVLMQDDAALAAAVKAARDAVLGSSPVRTARLPGLSRQAKTREEEPQYVLSLVDPATQQSGMHLGPSTDGTSGIKFTNHSRRYASGFVYKTRVTDAAGVQHDLNPPVKVVDGQFLDSVTAINGVFGSLIDLAAGDVAYAPKEGPLIQLPLGADESKAEFDVIAVGSSLCEDPLPAWYLGSVSPEKPLWDAKLTQNKLVTLGKDYVLPVVFSILIPSARIGDASVDPEDIAGFIASLLNAVPDAGIALNQNKPGEASRKIISAVANNAGLRQLVIDYLGRKFPTLLQGGMGRVMGILSRANALIAAADVALSGGDIALTTAHLIQAKAADRWSVSVVKPTVRLLPESSTVSPGAQVPLNVAVPVEATKFYTWSTTGQQGILQDSLGHSGTSFTSTSGSVVYQANPTTVEGQSDTVTVEVRVQNPGGTPGSRMFVGKATATVTAGVAHSGVFTLHVVDMSDNLKTSFGPTDIEMHMDHATKVKSTDPNLGWFLDILFRQNNNGRDWLQIHQYFSSIAAGVEAPAKRPNAGGGLHYAHGWIGGYTESFEAVSGTFKITNVVGPRIYLEIDCRVELAGYGYMQLKGTGNTTLVDK